ncbi:hypothetical protein [Massilia sp. 9096]|uniref:hypothetical protein n=1 Tax=Massilia sp. 9096 TaxID=1500894 RepID=UPI00055CF255|nr:hypothetical protein [Massilia sp. 9096]
MKTFWATYRASLAAALVFLVVTLSLFGVYAARTLKGNIDNHILSSQMFGVPAEVSAHGIRPLYGPKESGWDGQFYYYMSNDLLARRDASQHIDSPSYRYQRIGLSLYAAIVARLTGQHWVSPVTFFVSYLLLIVAATVAGARLLARYDAQPWLILLWSFSVGTQLTLFNALPDAAADAFLILSLALLFSRLSGWAFIPFTFSALSREVYAVFPSAALLFLLLSVLRSGGIANMPQRILGRLRQDHAYLLLVPGIVAVAWHVYVTRHFGIPPSAQASGILGLPLVAWGHSYVTALHGNASNARLDFGASEAVNLLLFLIVLAVALWSAVQTMRQRSGVQRELARSIALPTLFFTLLYLCFGPTVTSHYSGYMKAAAVFFFLVPMMLSVSGAGHMLKGVSYALLALALVYSNTINILQRVLAQPTYEDQYTRMSLVPAGQPIACFGNYRADIRVNKITLLKAPGWAAALGNQDRMVINVALTNTGDFPFVSDHAIGGVFMSYHWNDGNGQTIVDGIRSALPGAVMPGQTANVDVFVPVPDKAGLTLRLSPVQEGCAWFYQANPQVGAGIGLVLDR